MAVSLALLRSGSMFALFVRASKGSAGAYEDAQEILHLLRIDNSGEEAQRRVIFDY